MGTRTRDQLLREKVDRIERIEAAREVDALGRALHDLVRFLSRAKFDMRSSPEPLSAETLQRAREVLEPLLADTRMHEVEGDGWGAPPVAYGVGIGDLSSQVLELLP